MFCHQRKFVGINAWGGGGAVAPTPDRDVWFTCGTVSGRAARRCQDGGCDPYRLLLHHPTPHPPPPPSHGAQLCQPTSAIVGSRQWCTITPITAMYPSAKMLYNCISVHMWGLVRVTRAPCAREGEWDKLTMHPTPTPTLTTFSQESSHPSSECDTRPGYGDWCSPIAIAYASAVAHPLCLFHFANEKWNMRALAGGRSGGRGLPHSRQEVSKTRGGGWGGAWC